MSRYFIIILLIWMFCATCYGGMETTTGKERGLWGEGGYSVIIARVLKTSELPPEPDQGTHRLALEPLALLAGSIDPSSDRILDVTMYARGQTSTQLVPHIGGVVIAVVSRKNFIVSDLCTFMPGRSALVQVDGLGDRRVIETIKAIRDAREEAKTDLDKGHADGPSTRANAPAAKSK